VIGRRIAARPRIIRSGPAAYVRASARAGQPADEADGRIGFAAFTPAAKALATRIHLTVNQLLPAGDIGMIR